MKVLCASQMGSSTALGQPMRAIAIAKALQRRGNRVKFLASGKLAAVVRNHGLEVIPLPELPEIDFQFGGGPDRDERRQEERLAQFKQSIAATTEAEQAALAVERPDVLLCGSPLSIHTAKKAGIPCVLAILQPHGQKTLRFFKEKMAAGQSQTGRYLSDLMRALDPKLADAGPAGLQTLLGEGLDLIFIEGMPEIGGAIDLGATEAEWFAKMKDKVRFTGPLLAEDPRDLPEQAELKQRHGGDPAKPLVYVTIGGGTSLIGEEFLHLVLETFRRLPEINGVIATGLALPPEELAKYRPPANLSIRGFVPGTELIKASDLTVFHGGSSTLMTCIACGRPALIIPSMAEQEDNGMVLAQHGAGIVLDKKELTQEILEEAIRKVLGEPGYREKALQLKALGEKYGGPDRAAALVEELVRERGLVHAGPDFSGR